MASRATPSPLAKRLAAYSATAGAALAVAPAASGQVVYTDVEPDAVIGIGEEILLDFDGDGTDDMRFLGNAGGGPNTAARMNMASANSAAAAINAVAGSDAQYFDNPRIGSASRLSNGSPVDANLNFEDGDVFNVGVLASIFNGNPYYNFVGVEGFVGFRFQAGGGTTHYGWARIAINEDATQLTLLDYAFDATPDATIMAGDIGVAVEPGALPDGYAFTPIGPNPVRSSANFTLMVAETETVRVGVFDMLGREVSRVFEGELPGGISRRMELQVSDLPAGTYVVRATGDTFDTVQRITVTR
ncbi:MAG: T9SS type A sorting domain-containing protein [Bacteroidota bacterium]